MNKLGQRFHELGQRFHELGQRFHELGQIAFCKEEFDLNYYY